MYYMRPNWNFLDMWISKHKLENKTNTGEQIRRQYDHGAYELNDLRA